YLRRGRRCSRGRARRRACVIMERRELLAASQGNLMAASVAHWIACTEAEGPGRRFALWFQGCPLRCPGCCNPEMLPFDGGRQVPMGELAGLVFDALNRHGVEGITFLGGEPLAHAPAAAAL